MKAFLTSRVLTNPTSGVLTNSVRLKNLAAAVRAFRVVCLMALLLAASDATASAQQQQPPTPTQQGQTTAAPPVDEDEESESIDLRDDVATRPRATDPATIMRTAKTVFVHSKTVYVKDSEVENALRKRREFQEWGMSVTRDESRADLVVEVERKVFTRRFVFTVIEPRTLTVVTSGKARSIIFGKTIAHKVAEKFVNRFKPVRN